MLPLPKAGNVGEILGTAGRLFVPDEFPFPNHLDFDAV
jgi:hypothetical protein